MNVTQLEAELARLKAGRRRWRVILNRVTHHPKYTYETPYSEKRVLLQLAAFAFEEMSHCNDLYWRKKREARA